MVMWSLHRKNAYDFYKKIYKKCKKNIYIIDICRNNKFINSSNFSNYILYAIQLNRKFS